MIQKRFPNYLIAIYYLFILFIPALLFSQQRQYQLLFSKDNISWQWQGGLKLSLLSGENHTFFLNNMFSSNLFNEIKNNRKWKDENTLETGWKYYAGGRWGTATKIQSHIFSDENAIVNFSKHFLSQQLDYLPLEGVRISPALGIASEEVYSFRDQGWFASFAIDADDLDLGGYGNFTNGKSTLFFFPGRRNQDHRYFTAWTREFSEYASDSIRVGFEYVDNTYASNTAFQNDPNASRFENVRVDSRYLYNRLNYRLSPRSLLSVETDLSNRSVSQVNPSLSNNRREFKLANRFELVRRGDALQYGLAVFSSQTINEASQVPSSGRENRTDLEGLQTAFNIFANWMATRRDRFLLTFSYTKYEYTSPDTTQSIDEDDLRFFGDFTYSHRFSSYFAAKFHINAYLYHQIYIKSSRSANNNWNRIYRMGPSFYFTLPNVLENVSGIKILANYTVYDFEDILPQVRSYIYRKLIYSDSLRINISSHLRLSVLYQLEKEDNGTFYKSLFAQQINRELTSHFIDISLLYIRIRGLQVSTGMNWYLRDEWTYKPEREKSREYFLYSPRITVMYAIRKNLMFQLNFSPKVYRDFNIKRQYYGTGQVNMRYYF